MGALAIAMTLLVLVSLTACGTVSRKSLFHGVAVPRERASISIRVHELGYLAMNWKCAKLCGTPRLMSPLLLPYGGCANLPTDEEVALSPGHKPWCDVYVSAVTRPTVLEHELRHCEGWDHDF